MKKYIVDNPVFSDSIDIVEVTDPAHADRINQAPKQIFENTLALKRQVDGNRILIDLSGSEYDQNIYYPVTGTPIPKGGLHKIRVYSTFESGGHPSWATNASGYSCNMEIYDKAQTWGQADGAAICTDYSWKHTGQSPCGYLQMTHSSIPVVILRGGGVYYIETDYAEGWTVRTDVYTYDGDTVRPGTKRTLKFERATIFADLNGNVAGKVNGYTLGKNVPSDAQLTDTVYTHPTTAGYKHIPSGGSDGQVLRWSANGTAIWGAETIGSIEDIIFFGEEQNPEGVENKEVFIPNFTLTDGVKVTIRFGTGCLVDNATLNVSGTGAYPIMLDAVTPLSNGFIDYYGDIAELVYYGEKWFLVGCSLWRKVDQMSERIDELQEAVKILNDTVSMGYALWSGYEIRSQSALERTPNYMYQVVNNPDSYGSQQLVIINKGESGEYIIVCRDEDTVSCADHETGGVAGGIIGTYPEPSGNDVISLSGDISACCSGPYLLPDGFKQYRLSLTVESDECCIFATKLGKDMVRIYKKYGH